MSNNKNLSHKNFKLNLFFIILFTFAFIDNASFVYDTNFKLSFNMLMAAIDLYLIFFNIGELVKKLKFKYI